MAKRRHDVQDEPAPIGFTYKGWTFVGFEPFVTGRDPKLPAFFRLHCVKVLFQNDRGDKIWFPVLDDGQAITIRHVKDAVSGYALSVDEERLAREYARMC